MSTSPDKFTMARKRIERKEIPLPDGEVLVPRARFANDELQMSDRAVKKLNLPTTFLSCVAYVPRRASLKIIADQAKRRNEPPTRRTQRRRP